MSISTSGVPVFYKCDDSLPRTSALVNGAVLAAALLAGVCLLIARGGGFPSVLAVIYAIHCVDGSSLGFSYAVEGESALRKVSEPTGGRTFHVSQSLPLEAVFNTIREEMRSQ